MSRRALERRVFPYLLRNVSAKHPNHIWGIDITYIRLRESWMYLVAILDWFSRYVVAWELDDTLEIDFVLSAVDRALAIAKPAVWNSDQACQDLGDTLCALTFRRPKCRHPLVERPDALLELLPA